MGGHSRTSSASLSASAVMLLAFALLGLFLVAVMCSACGGASAADDPRPLVVTTVPIIYSLTANVAGDLVRVENLLPPGTSPHQVSFTPRQARLVYDSDLLVMNGAALDFWVDDLIDSAGKETLLTVVASEGLEFLRPGEPIPIAGSASAHEEHEDVDPHVWLDAANAQKMVANVRDGLKTLDPAHAADYERQAAAYSARLSVLDEEIRAATANLPNRDFVSFHSAWQYYARAYGLNQVGVIQEFPGKEPSPRYLQGLVNLVKELDVRAVFTEPQFSPRPAETLAREAGVRTFEVDPEGSELAPTMYEDLMRANTATFVEALR